jgi:pantoate--beta-alanine ligase
VPELVSSIAELRKVLHQHRRTGKTIGFVPTMGALHLGHRRLLEIARREADVVLASIFVNPTQFNRQDDLDHYPRTIDADLALCAESGTDIVFAPSASEMYPQICPNVGDFGETQLTHVEVPALAQTLCGPGRPGHFRGVATVVMKLLQIVQPDRAYFGEKDAQQLAIIKRMVSDLNVPVTIVPVPTVREPDGLAMSSRNQHLSPHQRGVATVLSRALFTARDLITAGENSSFVIGAAAEAIFSQLPPGEISVEYFSIVDPETLAAVETISGPVLLAGALHVGATRLIDNVTVHPPDLTGSPNFQSNQPLPDSKGF